MAGPPIDRIPLYVTMLPALGIVAWLAVGKVGLGLLALVLAAVLLGNVVAAVHHAEVVALRVGEPHGRLVLARRLRQNYGGCGQVRRPTVQDPSRQTRKSKFRHHKAATDRFGRPAEHRCGNSNGRSRVQIANLANIAVYVVPRIVLVPISGKHLANSN